MINRKLNVALIGCGEIAKVHSKVLSINKNVCLKWFVEVINEKANLFSKLYGGKPISDYSSILDDSNLDLVHICTPHSLHSKIAIDFLKKGKNVLVEKPISISLKEANKMIYLSDKNRSKLGAVLQHRYDNNVKLLFENIKYLGKIHFINSYLLCNRPKEYYSGWRGIKSYGDSLLINQFIHFMDIIQLIAGELVDVSGFIENFSKKSIVEDSVSLSLKFKNDVFANIFITSNSPYNFKYSIEVHGENGSIFLNGNSIKMVSNKKSFFSKKKFSSLFKFDNNIDLNKKYYGAGHYPLINNFIISILEDTKKYISAKDALPSLKISLLCYKKIK